MDTTKDQNLESQINILEQNGCQRIFQEKVSSTKTNREELNNALNFVVWKLDRIGRSVKQLVAFVEDLHSKNIGFKSISGNIDTSTFR